MEIIIISLVAENRKIELQPNILKYFYKKYCFQNGNEKKYIYIYYMIEYSRKLNIKLFSHNYTYHQYLKIFIYKSFFPLKYMFRAIKLVAV